MNFQESTDCATKLKRTMPCFSNRKDLFRFGQWILLLLFIPVSSAFCQFNLIFQKDGCIDGIGSLGHTVAGAGDVNRDGFADVIVGTLGKNAYVYSGRDSSLLYQFWNNLELHFGAAVSGGDINGDGYSDLIIGSPITDSGNVYIYSGSNGDLLYRLSGPSMGCRFGASVDAMGDISNPPDGKAEFIVGAPYCDSAFVYSGTPPIVIYRKGGVTGSQFGSAVAGGGGYDGVFVIGAYNFENSPAINRDGAAYIYWNSTGNLSFSMISDSGEWLGYSVGEGVGLVVIGAPLANNFAGAVYLRYYNGSLPALANLAGTQGGGQNNGERFGHSVDIAGNVNGAGGSDIIVGAPYKDSVVGENVILNQAGAAYIFTAGSGAELFRVTGKATDQEVGFSVAGAGDIHKENPRIDEFIVGAPTGCGSAFVYSQCAGLKADMNGDSEWTPSDVVLELQCVFNATGNCQYCFADLNCDGSLTPSDAVIMLNYIFLGTPLTC